MMGDNCRRDKNRTHHRDANRTVGGVGRDRVKEGGGEGEEEKAGVFEIPTLGKYLAELFH